MTLALGLIVTGAFALYVGVAVVLAVGAGLHRMNKRGFAAAVALGLVLLARGFALWLGSLACAASADVAAVGAGDIRPSMLALAAKPLLLGLTGLFVASVPRIYYDLPTLALRKGLGQYKEQAVRKLKDPEYRWPGWSRVPLYLASGAFTVFGLWLLWQIVYLVYFFPTP